MRKLFASAALGTAVISWLATAIGLNHYVFHTFWQALVLSGAIQGPLFALSTRGLDLFYHANFRRLGKILVVVIWIALLASSSTFSYVSIALAAYSEKALQVDAEQILSNYCISQDYQLLDSCNSALGVYSRTIQEYIQCLVTSEGGVGFDKRDIAFLESHITDLEKLEKENQQKEISVLANTGVIRERLKQFLNGEFNERDVTDINNLISNKLAEINNSIEALEKAGQDHQKNIEDFNARLSQFKSLSNPYYIELKEKLEKEQEEAKSDEEMKEQLNNIREALSDSKEYVNIMCRGTESQLHTKSNELVIAMNKETLDTNTMMDIAQEIYTELVQDNVGAEDIRIRSYGSFRDAVLGYDQVIEAKQDLHKEIERLLFRSQSGLMSNTVIEQKLEENETTAAELEVRELSSSEQWNTYWRTRLGNIEAILEKLPDMIWNENGEGKAISIKDTKEISVSKAEMVSQISGYVRMYLTDLNDFEKYWGLLLGEHPNKTVLKFSLVIAVMIDLFSLSTGILLYFYKSETKEGRESL